MKFAVSPTMSLGVDGRYHSVNTENDFGVNSNWFAINGKLTFHMPMAK